MSVAASCRRIVSVFGGRLELILHDEELAELSFALTTTPPAPPPDVDVRWLPKAAQDVREPSDAVLSDAVLAKRTEAHCAIVRRTRPGEGRITRCSQR